LHSGFRENRSRKTKVLHLLQKQAKSLISFNGTLIVLNHIGDINLFLRVLDSGSISGAARALNLSVAVASQRLKRLERELGGRLLHRTTRRLSATPEGTVLAEQGRVLVDEIETLTAGLRQAGTGVAGTLRVTTASTFGRQYVSPLLPEFLALHPDVKLSVELNDENLFSLWIPGGFAHGFCVLSEVADVIYKCTVPYEADDDRGVAWNDPLIGIDWPVDNPALSAKDSAYDKLSPNRDDIPTI